jgi:hypothetical protein
MRGLLLLLALPAFPFGGIARASANPGSVALLPFENLTVAPEAPSRVSRGIAEALAKNGWKVLEGAPVDEALDAARVRYLDSLESAVRPMLAEALGAPTFVLGSVLAWDAGADPRVAFAVTLLRSDGATLFSDLISMRGEDAEGLFESGRPFTLDEVAAEAIRRAAKRLPRLTPRRNRLRPAVFRCISHRPGPSAPRRLPTASAIA